ncbi:MAG: nicotinate phosphoribosyltransferase [Chthoniobacter sp.]|nr:nicotinate phosphoribosyltransferase [Chthoniobacter sp.]
MNTQDSALLTDLYQLTMLQGYWQYEMYETAVFEFFVRKLPASRNFLVAAGLEQVLSWLEGLAFSTAELAWLSRTQHFHPGFTEWLKNLHFTGDVDAMPEGTVFFPNEPILRVVARLPEAQLVETRLVNLLHFQTSIASKAVRIVLMARGKDLVDFGLRRAHGAEAGLLAARASYLAGFSSTATVLAGQLFDIPVSGTMAHSFVQAHDDEAAAFLRFADANPHHVTLVIDTYNTEAAAEKVVQMAQSLHQRGIEIRGVRIDSGDLAAHARRVRQILDAGGLNATRIFASGSLDETAVRDLLQSGAPIDGFGIGSRLDTSSDAPYLDCAYKLQEYAGRPRRKRSEGKATWPGRKQVWRTFDSSGCMAGDVLALETEPPCGKPLLLPVMRNGRRVAVPEKLPVARRRTAEELAHLPERLRSLDHVPPFEVSVSAALGALASSMDAEIH